MDRKRFSRSLLCMILRLKYLELYQFSVSLLNCVLMFWFLEKVEEQHFIYHKPTRPYFQILVNSEKWRLYLALEQTGENPKLHGMYRTSETFLLLILFGYSVYLLCYILCIKINFSNIIFVKCAQPNF